MADTRTSHNDEAEAKEMLDRCILDYLRAQNFHRTAETLLKEAERWPSGNHPPHLHPLGNYLVLWWTSFYERRVLTHSFIGFEWLKYFIFDYLLDKGLDKTPKCLMQEAEINSIPNVIRSKGVLAKQFRKDYVEIKHKNIKTMNDQKSHSEDLQQKCLDALLYDPFEKLDRKYGRYFSSFSNPDQSSHHGFETETSSKTTHVQNRGISTLQHISNISQGSNGSQDSICRRGAHLILGSRSKYS